MLIPFSSRSPFHHHQVSCSKYREWWNGRFCRISYPQVAIAMKIFCKDWPDFHHLDDSINLCSGCISTKVWMTEDCMLMARWKVSKDLSVKQSRNSVSIRVLTWSFQYHLRSSSWSLNAWDVLKDSWTRSHGSGESGNHTLQRIDRPY